MAVEVSEKRALVDLCNEFGKAEGCLTAAQIAAAYKAALVDFVGGRTSRASVTAVLATLRGALDARRAQILEEEEASSQRVKNYY